MAAVVCGYVIMWLCGSMTMKMDRTDVSKLIERIEKTRSYFADMSR